MFPQSELDNYKLQVELLQEKLQRSEISRQQLEHKLDKILQKRDEHDKIQRSKSKHKYQEFLEEQHRRNERNKQLVQMLERIEQQTVAMNSRSERLKMMKLQYEMYFAKLVHSQTRRCIQSSTMPMMTPMMGPANMPGPNTQTGMMMPTTSVEGYNYGKVYEETPLMGNSFQRYPDPMTPDREQFNRSQQQDIMSAKLMEMPLPPDYSMNSDKNNYMNIRKSEPPYPMQQPYEANVTMGNMERRRPFNGPIGETRQQQLYNNAPVESGGIMPHPGESSLLNKSKPHTDYDMPSMVSSSSSAPLTFDRIPNINTASNMRNTIKETFDSSKDFPNEQKQQLKDILPEHQQNFEINSTSSTGGAITDLTSSTSSQLAQDSLNDNSSIQEQSQEIAKPQQELIPTVRQQEVDRPHDNAPVKEEVEKVQNMKTEEFKLNEIEPQIPTSTVKSLPTPDTTMTTAPTPPPVSIENIENAIYGELVNSPEETQQTLQPDKPSVSPTLLDNLVTQAPVNTEPNHIPENQPKEETQQHVPDASNSNYDTTNPAEITEGTSEQQSYPQMYDYNTTTPSSDGGTTNTEDYAGYENNNNVVDENQQQQQQYDYSNYDPTQYSYPGYIYDETTGEYKPDPNATAEQYATDQQYANEGYEQQYQQQEGYDYNQTYDHTDPQADAVDPAVYENYDATQAEQPTNTETAPKQEEQQQLDQPVTETAIPDAQPADVAETSGKNIKPTSILATADKKDNTQKNKKRVNFVDSSETDESTIDKNQSQAAVKPNAGNDSDFDFSSGSDATPKQA